jgi:hypothetical protein
MPDRLSVEMISLFAVAVMGVATKGQKSPGRAATIAEMRAVGAIWGPRRSACTISYFAAIMRRCREVSVSPRPLGASSPIGLESVNADCAKVAVVCSDDE